jgi:hypothetical protein
MPADEVGELEWQVWCDRLRREGLSRSRISTLVAVASAIYAWAITPTRRYASRNPMRLVESSCCLRGIDTLSAAGLCCEIGDFARFARAGQVMSFVGLVPSEDSTGERRRLGSITKTGSGHARRLLVEAAWHYRNPPRLGRELHARQAGQSAEAVAISWSAQQRLHRTWRRMERRGKRRPLIAVAVARELTGFCWAIARTE